MTRLSSLMHNWKEIYDMEPAKAGVKRPMDPPGYNASAYDTLSKGSSSTSGSAAAGNTTAHYERIKQEMLLIAKAPLGTVLNNLMMVYMAPNGLSIITLGMLSMVLKGLINDLMSMNTKFEIDGNDQIDYYDLVMIKMVYCIGLLANLAICLWKLNSMGLLPTHSSDWVHWELPLLAKYVTI